MARSRTVLARTASHADGVALARNPRRTNRTPQTDPTTITRRSIRRSVFKILIVVQLPSYTRPSAFLSLRSQTRVDPLRCSFYSKVVPRPVPRETPGDSKTL